MNLDLHNFVHFDHVIRNRLRRFMNTICAASVVVCFSSVLLWGWSYWWYDAYVPNKTGWCIQSYHGSIHCIRAGAGAGLGAPGWTTTSIRNAKIDQHWYITRSNRFTFLGFKSLYLEGRCSVVGVPYWFIATVSAMLVIWWRGQVRRQTRRFPKGLCPDCGYDIRGYPYHCPECGRLIGHRVPAVMARPRIST